MLRIVKEFAPWILFDGFEEKFLYHWSVERSPRVYEVNPGRGPSFPPKMIWEKMGQDWGSLTCQVFNSHWPPWI